MNRSLVLFLLFAAVGAVSAAPSHSWPLYADGRFEFLLIGEPSELSPDSLCQALKTANPTLGKPRCAVAASLLRDSLFSRHIEWLRLNLLPRAELADLAARHPSVRGELTKRRDEYLLLAFLDSSSVRVVLYADGKPLPVEHLSLPPGKPLLPPLLSLFRGPAVPIPSEKEREETRKEPDRFFRDQIPLDRFFSLGGGALRGIGGHPSSQIDHYELNTDSSSAWDWIGHKSPVAFVEYGIAYARFAAIAGYFQWSQHRVKYNPLTNPAVDSWDLLRWEFGVRTRLGYTFFPHTAAEIYPYLGLGFHFTVYQEFLEWKSGVSRPEDHFRLVALTGASVGTGVQLLYNSRWGVRVEGGTARRARRARDVEPGGTPPPDRPAEESYELYWSVGVLKNFRKFL